MKRVNRRNSNSIYTENDISIKILQLELCIVERIFKKICIILSQNSESTTVSVFFTGNLTDLTKTDTQIL